MVDSLTDAELDEIFKRFEKSLTTDQLREFASKDTGSKAKDYLKSNATGFKNAPSGLVSVLKERTKALNRIKEETIPKETATSFWTWKSGTTQTGIIKINSKGNEVIFTPGAKVGRDIKTGRFASIK